MPHELEPAWEGYLADPFVLRVGEGFYAYGTGGPKPGAPMPILRSADLSTWEIVGHAFDALPGQSNWAPEVAFRDGLYHLYYSSGGPEGEGHRIRLAVGESPEGPFRLLPGAVIPGEPFSIDAHPFRDPSDGAWYLFFAKDFFDGRVGTGIAAAPLGDNMASLTAQPTPIMRSSADWQIFERNRLWHGRRWEAWHTVEGPFVVFRNGLYWLFYSGGLWKGSGYGIGCLFAEAVLGPYDPAAAKDGPNMLQSSDSLRGPGHCSIFVGPDGEDRIAFHAWDEGFAARRMYIARLMWESGGPRVSL